MAVAALAPGTALDGGAYVVEALLGWGDSGAVYAARQTAVGRVVAVKEVFPVGARRAADGSVAGPGLAAERDQLLRAAGARLGERLPGVETVLDGFEAGGTAYVVLERLAGETLAARAARAPLALAELRSLGRAAAAGLAALHATGRPHGDVRPEHLFLDQARGPVWIDVGGGERGGVDDPAASQPYRPAGANSAFGADVFGFATMLAALAPGYGMVFRHTLTALAVRASTAPAAGLRELLAACGADGDALAPAAAWPGVAAPAPGRPEAARRPPDGAPGLATAAARTCPGCERAIAPELGACPACGESLTADELPAGTIVRGRFVVERVIGRGGFGIVYAARHLVLGNELVLKELYPPGARRSGREVLLDGAPDAAARLAGARAEGDALASLAHPGLALLLDRVEAHGTVYLAMGLLRGETLERHLTRGPLSDEAVRRVGLGLAEALEAVHAVGLLHRDLKPANVMLQAAGGPPVLLDFGSAAGFDEAGAVRHERLVTPGYSPLEQYLEEARFAPTSDVYALAATLRHAVTGAPPPPAPDRARGARMAALSGAVSPGLARALERGLALRAADRPPTAAAFRALLAADLVSPQPPPGASISRAVRVGTLIGGPLAVALVLGMIATAPVQPPAAPPQAAVPPAAEVPIGVPAAAEPPVAPPAAGSSDEGQRVATQPAAGHDARALARGADLARRIATAAANAELVLEPGLYLFADTLAITRPVRLRGARTPGRLPWLGSASREGIIARVEPGGSLDLTGIGFGLPPGVKTGAPSSMWVEGGRLRAAGCRWRASEVLAQSGAEVTIADSTLEASPVSITDGGLTLQRVRSFTSPGFKTVGADAVSASTNSRCVIVRSRFEGWPKRALHVDEPAAFDLRASVLRGNGLGLSLHNRDPASRVQVTNNQFLDNEIGISLWGDAPAQIAGNTLSGSTETAVYDATTWGYRAGDRIIGLRSKGVKRVPYVPY